MTLPKSFEEYTRQLMGKERFTRLCQALDTPSPVSIRFNPFKTTDEERQSMTFPGHDGERIRQTDNRPAPPCRCLLCAGGFVNIHRPRHPNVRHRTRENA